MEGEWRDIIDTFLDLTCDVPSSEHFRLWAGIAAVGAALERRVWLVSAKDAVYPSLYTLLVGQPGTGKSQAIRPVRAMWFATKELKIAPHSVTKASLMDELDAAKRLIMLPPVHPLYHHNPVEYHSLQIAASEFGVLVSEHELKFLNFLNQIYDNDPDFGESLRTGSRKLNIINPQINILAGTQPAYLAALLPEEAWGMGFMTRMIMVHSSQKFKPRLFDNEDSTINQDPQFKYIVTQFKELIKVYGKASLENEAKEAIQDWSDAGCPPEPEHSRLSSYNSRRILHVLRLCLISAASAGHPLIITLDDFHRALGWLLAAEATMPDIFKEMVQRSDRQVIEELHVHVWSLWAKDRKPVHEARLYYFLQAKVPGEKIPRLLEVAIRSNILDCKLMDNGARMYVPRPKSDHGIE